MKKEYMVPQLEEIVLKSKGALLTESLTKDSNTEVSGGLASEFFGGNDTDNEDW